MNAFSTTASPAGKDIKARRLAILLPFVAACIVFAPALGAGFVADDWAILALARHGGPGWVYFFTDHAATYSYRPNGMLVWHLVALFAGDAALPQYVVQFLLHAANAALLAALLLGLGVSSRRSMLSAIFFAVHPIAFGTGLWLSDRYDLLAVNGALALLLSILAWRRGQRAALLLMALSACWAAGAKETALAVAPVAAIWIAMSSRSTSRRARLFAWSAALLPFVLALLARWWIFGSSGVERIGTELTLLQGIVTGVGRWLRTLPMALVGVDPGGLWTAVLGVLLIAAVVVAVIRASRPTATPEQRLALVAGCALLLLPGLMQAPVTAFMLATDQPLALTSNMRFFYLAVVGLIIGTSPLGWTQRRTGQAAAAITVLAIALFTVPGWRSANAWREASTQPVKQQLVSAIGDALRQTPYQPGCVLYLDRIPEQALGVYLYADSIAKSSLPAGDPRLDCMVLTSRQAVLVTTGRETRQLPEGVVPRARNGIRETVRDLKLESRPIMGGRIHVHFPDTLSPEQAQRLPGVRMLHWTGTAMVDAAR